MAGRWTSTVRGWGATQGALDAAYRRVRAAYREPERRYHTIEHIGEVLGALDLDASSLDPVPGGRDRDRTGASGDAALEVAAWLHDAVYVPTSGPGASEAASAELAAELLDALGAPPDVVAETARLITLTAGHTVEPDDRAGARLADADLAILGAPTARYRRYARDVRAEYGWLDDESWRRGRSVVLSEFAGRSRIYLGDAAHRRLDGAARRNLAWELAALARGQA